MSFQAQAFSTHEITDPTKRVVTDGETFERLMRFLHARPWLVFDYETSGLAYYRNAQAIGIGLGTWDEKGTLWKTYVPFRHKTGEDQLDINIIGPAIGQLLGRTDTLKIAHNIKFEDHFSRKEGWTVAGERYDTSVAARLSNENEDIGLEKRAILDLGITDAMEDKKMMTRIVAGLAKANKMKVSHYKDKFGYSEVPIDVCGDYCCTDIDFTGRLYFSYELLNLSRTYSRIWPTEMKLTRILADMEEAGMPIDVPYLEQVRDDMHEKKEIIEKDIYNALHGQTFNFASDAKMRDFLQNKLGCHLEKLTKAGKIAWRHANWATNFDKSPYFAVDSEVLRGFAPQFPVLQSILDWREADKIATTYTTSIINKVDANNYLHGNLKQAGTNTGRLSSDDPNYQNFPAGPLIRSAFPVVAKDWVRLFLDYSQIELRVLAHYSQDPLMVQTYINDGDIHETTRREVSRLAGRDYERRPAKVVNFGLSYGLTAEGLSSQAGIPIDDARLFMATFFKKFTGIEVYRNELWAKARRQGCQWQNLFGRTRRLPDLMAVAKWQVSRAERQMMGSSIQGTAADIMKETLVRVDEFLTQSGLPARMCNTVHDEVQIDCRIDAVEQVIAGVKRVGEDYPEFHPIPIIMDCEVTSTNWGEKVSYDEWKQQQ